MYKVPMAASPSPVDESSGLRLSDQFPDFPRHGVAMLFFWRLSPRGDGVKDRSPSQQPRAPADVADSYGAKRPEPTGPGGGSRRNDYGVRGSSLSRGPRSVHRRPVAPVRHGPEPGSVHHRRPPTAVPRRAAGGGVRLGGAAGIRAVRGGVPDQVRLRGRPEVPQRAEDPAHDAGRQPVLHHPGPAEPGRSVPGPEHLELRSSTWRW